jgi:DNA-binding Lrp family transcriptional regulator
MKAYVLIHVRPGSVAEVISNLRRLKGILEANMTFGPYDVVATVQTSDINHLGHLVASEIQPIPGILDTLTCMIVDV